MRTAHAVSFTKANVTATGNSGDIDLSEYSRIAIDIDVDTIAGTSPTVTFDWERKDAHGEYYDVAAGAAITAAGKQSIEIGPGTANEFVIGKIGRLVWTLGGTVTDLDFKVTITAC